MKYVRIVAGLYLGALLGICVGAALGTFLWTEPGSGIDRFFVALGWGVGLGALIGLVVALIQNRDADDPVPRERFTPTSKWMAAIVGLGVAVLASIRPLIATTDSQLLPLVVIWGLTLGVGAAIATLFFTMRVARRR